MYMAEGCKGKIKATQWTLSSLVVGDKLGILLICAFKKINT